MTTMSTETVTEYSQILDSITEVSNGLIDTVLSAHNDTNGFEIPRLVFSWTDYFLFSFMLGVSALIGVYFGYCGKTKQNTTTEYLLGGKKMGVFPVSVSLVASHLSGITLLGVPAEIYMYGTSYWICIISGVITSIIVAYIYLPVFYKLQLTSSFEYLQLRFDNKVRVTASLLYIIAMITYIPIVIYIPALAFSQVTGVNIHLVTPVVCTVCIFYTTIGGLKAVVWTDTLQFIVTISAMTTVMILGTVKLGSVSDIWSTADQGSRIDFFDMELSLTKRTTFLSVISGMTVMWICGLGINQGCVQKFLSVPTIRDAKMAVFLLCIGMGIVKSVSCFTGLIMYANYKDCDPLSSGMIKRPDQLLPYYVMDVAGKIPGLPGLFVAGTFCAALSTMSAGLNTMSGTIYEDFIGPHMPKNTSEAKASNIMKITVVIVGTICVCLVLIVERLGAILQAAISLNGITSGPLLGLFTLGMLFPRANKKGAFYGAVGSLLISTWIVTGAQFEIAMGRLTYPPLPLSTSGCNFEFTPRFPLTNGTTPAETNNDNVFFLYRISFYYYTLIGTMVVIIIAMIVSYLSGPEDLNDLNPDLITPMLHGLLPEQGKKKYPKDYKTVEHALQTLNCDKK